MDDLQETHESGPQLANHLLDGERDTSRPVTRTPTQSTSLDLIVVEERINPNAVQFKVESEHANVAAGSDTEGHTG